MNSIYSVPKSLLCTRIHYCSNKQVSMFSNGILEESVRLASAYGNLFTMVMGPIEMLHGANRRRGMLLTKVSGFMT